MALAHSYQTSRLLLRPLAATDEVAVVSAIGDIAVSGWLAVVPHPYSAADFHRFFNKIAIPGEAFVIEDASGFAGIMSIEEGMLGYWLAPRAHGLGYATEAARCLVTAYFDGSGDTLVSGYFEGNVRSARVLDKLGFVETHRNLRFCRAFNAERPHVCLELSRDGFSRNVVSPRV